MEIKIPPQAEFVINRLKASGYEAYIVGGCVRDSILGLKPNDWDVTTSALPQEMKSSLAGCKQIETGLKHGTITAIVDNMQIEITTFRIDGEYSDNRHPDEVHFTRKLSDDLARRDFTINALAYDHEAGIIDYFSGIDDLKNRTIRCVGEPNLRFHEDGLRILRAIRFSSTLGFSVEGKTHDSILQNANLLQNIAKERIQTEWNKLLCGKGAVDVLRKYQAVICEFIPEIAAMNGFEQKNCHHIYNVWEHTLKAVDSVDANPILRLTMLMHDIGKPFCFTIGEDGTGHFYGHDSISAKMAEIILKRLKYDNNTINQVITLVQYHHTALTPDKKLLLRWLARLGEQNLRLLLKVKAADILAQNPKYSDRLNDLKKIETALNNIIDEKLCFSLKDLQIKGKDLILLGIPEGQKIGIILSSLLEDVMTNKCENEHSVLINRALLMKEKEL